MISPAAYALIVSMIYFACMAVATVVLGATQPWKGREDLDVDAVNRFADFVQVAGKAKARSCHYVFVIGIFIYLQG